jgi:hypothetical protein
MSPESSEAQSDSLGVTQRLEHSPSAAATLRKSPIEPVEQEVSPVLELDLTVVDSGQELTDHVRRTKGLSKPTEKAVAKETRDLVSRNRFNGHKVALLTYTRPI